ncbi:MAG: TQO small subunit DoxD [Acidiferrobacter sp.]
MSRHAAEQTYDRTALLRLMGAVTLAVRLILGWIYWGGGTRRFIYAPQKLNPHAHSWMANKLQAGMPGAVLGLSHVVSAILHNPGLTYGLLVFITAVELLSGLGLIVGLLTRLSAIMSLGLSVSLMLIFGWQGATCIDEWTMAVSTFAMASTVLVAGAGVWSIDGWLMKKNPRLADAGWFRWLGSAPLTARQLESWGKGLGIVAILFTLVTYNYYRGSIFTPFHGGPVSPSKHHISLSHGTLSKNTGAVRVLAYLDGGTPAAPSHVIKVVVMGPAGVVVEQWAGSALQEAARGHIHNLYAYNTFAPGLYGLKAKMGAKAWIDLPGLLKKPLVSDHYQIIFENINGREFKAAADVGGLLTGRT